MAGRDRAGTARPVTSSAAKTMVTRHNFAIINFVELDVPEKNRFSFTVAPEPLHAQLLVEIAIVNFAPPTNADRAATHQTIDRCRIEGIDQQVHVFFELVVQPQVRGKAGNRQICDRPRSCTTRLRQPVVAISPVVRRQSPGQAAGARRLVGRPEHLRPKDAMVALNGE